MIRKIIVANRGEIARRVIRSCKLLGIPSVAVYSDVDAELPHVQEADESVLLGSARPAESYLNIDKLLEAMVQTGADAVHPGYGFLAENAAFAEMVDGKGFTWIGPTSKSIREMGDKQRAREIANGAGVPIVLGSKRFAEGDTDGIEAAGEAVGYPLLVKASAGGGGIGMRRVDDPVKLRETVVATQSMAGKAFGDGTIFLERYIPRARHVEVQVFGFGNGEGIHLFERDCSLQRRFQKVIEESPAPHLRPDVRDQMTSAAVALTCATNYAGAGTVEFIVDADTQEFFFLEMNTRIQVEHPVTEMVTCTDLVAMQIKLAQGTLETLAQDSIITDGAVIECRLYAENPARMFMPSPGKLTRFRLPLENESLRIDTGYVEGAEVTPFYDPMVAKIIVKAENRGAAIRKAIAALETLEVEGINTNREFLIECLKHEGFADGRVYTGFIDDNLKELTPAKKAVA